MVKARERITLRLEESNLKLMDEFLNRNENIGTRSQLCRMAVKSFIDQTSSKGNEVSVTIPRQYLEYIDSKVRKGYFLSREHAILRAVEAYFSGEGVEIIEKHQKKMEIGSGKRISLDYGAKEEVIGR